MELRKSRGSQPAGDDPEYAAINQAMRVIVNDHRWQASSHKGRDVSLEFM